MKPANTAQKNTGERLRRSHIELLETLEFLTKENERLKLELERVSVDESTAGGSPKAEEASINAVSLETDLKLKISELQKEVKYLRQTNISNDSEINSLKTSLKLASQVSQAPKPVAVQKSTICTQTEEIFHSDTMVKQLNNNLETLSKEVHIKNEEYLANMMRLQELNKSLENSVLALKNEKSETDELVRTLVQNLETSKIEIAHLTAELSKRGPSTSDIEREIADLRAKLDIERKKNGEHLALRENYRDKVKKLEDEIRRLNEKLHAIEADPLPKAPSEVISNAPSDTSEFSGCTFPEFVRLKNENRQLRAQVTEYLLEIFL